MGTMRTSSAPLAIGSLTLFFFSVAHARRPEIEPPETIQPTDPP